MKCITCKAPISPAFKASIRSNLCPACGGELMNEATLDLLDDLKDALEEMPADPEGIACWLLSHYEMRKVGTGEPVQQFYGNAPKSKHNQSQPEQSTKRQSFYGGGGGNSGSGGSSGSSGSGGSGGFASTEERLRNQPKVAPNKLQQFLKNAGIKEPKTKEHYEALMSQINGSGGGDYESGSESDYEDYENENLPENDDPEYTQAVLNASSERPMSKQDRMELQRMMGAYQGGSGSGSSGYESYDNSGFENQEGYDPTLPPALNMQRMERLRKQQELQSGGKVGIINRSG